MTFLQSRVGWGALAACTCCLAGCSFTLDGLTGGAGEEESEPDASQSVAPDAGPSDATTPTLDSGGADSAITDSSVTDGGGHLPTPDPSLDASADGGGGGKTCSGGEILCSGACIDPASDPSNCNGCGNVCATGRCGTSIAAPMTSLPAGWNFNGSASYNTSAPSAELTVANVPQQAGTFLYQNALGVDGMDVAFEFRIGLQGGLRDDGMGFVIEENGASAIGHLGSGLGMAGLTGFGVELDIFDNGDCGDTSDDHVGVRRPHDLRRGQRDADLALRAGRDVAARFSPTRTGTRRRSRSPPVRSPSRSTAPRCSATCH